MFQSAPGPPGGFTVVENNARAPVAAAELYPTTDIPTSYPYSSSDDYTSLRTFRNCWIPFSCLRDTYCTSVTYVHILRMFPKIPPGTNENLLTD